MQDEKEKKIRVSAVSFANSYPFIFGIENSKIINQIELSLDVPSDCAMKLLNNKVDLGLIPIALIPEMDYYEIVGNFCLSATHRVRSVILVTNSRLPELETIFLDKQSRTSNELVKILAKNYWNINPVFVFPENDDMNKIEDKCAALIIGDKSFQYESHFLNVIDMANEWNKFSKFPFVFACWVANKPLSEQFKEEFSEALKLGIDNIPVLLKYNYRNINKIPNSEQYLSENIDYILDNTKRNAMELFIGYIQK